jgi:pSer/pThr/pTyr-binding forkhead associated (FHA) protein
MDIRLVAEKGRERRVLPLPAGVTTLGRSRRCTIRIPATFVSRVHCRLYPAPEGFVVVEDLKSANGTQLNGSRITGPNVVRPGDHLKIGPITFVVEYELTPAALESLPLDRAETLPTPHTGRGARTETDK